MKPSPLRRLPQRHEPAPTAAVATRTERIGQRLQALRQLSDAQIEQILLHQRQHGLRFGDAAVALHLASQDEVARALAQQYDFPYATAQTSRLGSELSTALAPFGAQADVFRDLRSRLLLDVLDASPMATALAVVSSDAGDGRTYCAANLAVSLSQLGRRTLLVDADLRRPRLHQVFGLVGASARAGPAGLGGVLAGLHRAADVIQPVAELPSLELLPSGGAPPNPQDLLQRTAFALLLQELLARFDHVVVDTPAARHGADSRLLAAKCGAALVVGRQHGSRMRGLQDLLAGLTRSGTRCAGVLMNRH